MKDQNLQDTRNELRRDGKISRHLWAFAGVRRDFDQAVAAGDHNKADRYIEALRHYVETEQLENQYNPLIELMEEELNTVKASIK